MAQNIDFVYEGFEELEALGYVSDYVTVDKRGNQRVIRPALSLEECDDFFPKGTKVRFINKNGYDLERQRANEIIGTEQVLTVYRCHIGSCSSTYIFEEVEGTWNTVMFERVS